MHYHNSQTGVWIPIVYEKSDDTDKGKQLSIEEVRRRWFKLLQEIKKQEDRDEG